MKNFIAQEKLTDLLLSHWNILVTKITSAPQGFVAQTFYVETRENFQYFVKIYDSNTRYVSNVVSSLPVLHLLERSGIHNVAEVIRGVNGEYVYIDSHIMMVVFKKISGEWTFNYEKESLLKILLNIHSIEVSNNDIYKDIKSEGFEFEFEDELSANLLRLKLDRDVLEETGLRQSGLSFIYNAIDRFKDVCRRCRDTEFKLRITHGDAPGNVIKNSNSELFLVDWDDLILAPVERDLWYFENLESVKSIYVNYERSEIAYSYYLHRRFLDDLSGFLSEIFQEGTSLEAKLKNVQGIKNDVLGWLLPLVKTIELSGSQNESNLLKLKKKSGL